MYRNLDLSDARDSLRRKPEHTMGTHRRDTSCRNDGENQDVATWVTSLLGRQYERIF